MVHAFQTPLFLEMEPEATEKLPFHQWISRLKWAGGVKAYVIVVSPDLIAYPFYQSLAGLSQSKAGMRKVKVPDVILSLRVPKVRTWVPYMPDSFPICASLPSNYTGDTIMVVDIYRYGDFLTRVLAVHGLLSIPSFHPLNCEVKSMLYSTATQLTKSRSQSIP